jgi:hypothetical protein
MAIPNDPTDLSTTEGSNVPLGTDSTVTYPIDQMFRAHASIMRQIHDSNVLKAPIASPTFTGTLTAPTVNVTTALTAVSINATTTLAMTASSSENDGAVSARNSTGASLSIQKLAPSNETYPAYGYVYNSTNPTIFANGETKGWRWTCAGGERMRVADGGNVSIGTTTDAGKLAVEGEIAVKDGMTAPSATVGFAKLYVDTSDGDLKIIFGDGTVKTIATDTA